MVLQKLKLRRSRSRWREVKNVLCHRAWSGRAVDRPGSWPWESPLPSPDLSLPSEQRGPWTSHSSQNGFKGKGEGVSLKKKKNVLTTKVIGTIELTRFLSCRISQNINYVPMHYISPKVIIINSRLHVHETLFSKRRGTIWDTLEERDFLRAHSAPAFSAP